MFRKLKLWSHRLLDRDQGPDNEQSEELGGKPRRYSLQNVTTTGSDLRAGRNDPRELPRPTKRGLIRSPSQIVRKSLLHCCYKNSSRKENVGRRTKGAATGCTCANCKSLTQITECGICLEPLQGREVHSCTICANLMCKCCASRLQECAFCRTAVPLLPNVAMDRLLDRLALPCKNSRWGCPELVMGNIRVQHEMTCAHGTFDCPVGRHICGWHGGLSRIEAHLKNVHSLQPLTDNTIAIEISGFRGKAYAVDGRQYTVCLSYHGYLYMVKIILFQGKLRLSFAKMGSRPKKSKWKIQKRPALRYGVWIDISCTSTEAKALKGFLPFGDEICEIREIEVTCDSVLPPEDKDPDPSVKISVRFKSLNVI